jgi:Tfp pilus assembly protein PilZ
VIITEQNYAVRRENVIKLFNLCHIQECKPQSVYDLYELLCQKEISIDDHVYDYGLKLWLTVREIESLRLVLQIMHPELLVSDSKISPPPFPGQIPNYLPDEEDWKKALQDEAYLLFETLSKTPDLQQKKDNELKEILKDSKQKEYLLHERLRQKEDKIKAIELKHQKVQEIAKKYKSMTHELNSLLNKSKAKYRSLMHKAKKQLNELECLREKSTPEMSSAIEEIEEFELELNIEENERLKGKSRELFKKNSGHETSDALLSDEELERLTGDLFEIPNIAQWYYRKGNEEVGPLAFEEMIELVETGELERKNLIKRNNEGWKAIENTYEFSAPYLFHIKEIDGEISKSFFLKRESVRVPFYELVTVSFDESVVKGHCTSLSVGGCFVELSRKDITRIEKGIEISIELISDILDEDLFVKGRIVNISDARPRGVGVQFKELSEDNKKTIKSYVQSCLNSDDKRKKAA